MTNPTDSQETCKTCEGRGYNWSDESSYKRREKPSLKCITCIGTGYEPTDSQGKYDTSNYKKKTSAFHDDVLRNAAKLKADSQGLEGNPTKAEEMREKVLYEIPRTRCEYGCDGKGTYAEYDSDGDPTPAQCQYCWQVRMPQADRIMSLFTSALEAQDVESKRDIVFHILMTKTEGFYDDGDLFIKRGPVEQAMIDKVGYEAFKAIKEAVNAADLAELQSHPTKQSEEKV